MTRLLPVGLMLAIAAGGYIQVATQPVFWCGQVEGFPNTLVLGCLALAQCGLFMAAACSGRWQRAYWLSQLAMLPLLLFAAGQIILARPGIIVICAALGLGALTVRRNGGRGLFPVAAIGLLAAFGQVPFTLRGVTVGGWMITLAVTLAFGAACWVARHAPRIQLRLSGMVPLSLLLFAVLRAKMPDTAYDSLSYKATIPFQMAEWRTGDMALIDGYMVGTNLQEMLNALLVILTPGWLPAFTSTASYVLMALITPLAFPVQAEANPVRRGILAFAALSAFTLTEAAMAQGTAYQEPLMLLFLLASIIRGPAWPGFLAMAIAVKINALFIAPLVLVHHVLNNRTFWRSPGLMAAGVATALLVLVPQLARNVIFSGRLLGMSETLAAVTDPPGPHQVMTVGATRYDRPVRGGIVNNAVQSACNIWLLDRLCSVRFEGMTEAGFNVFPASRATLLAVVLAGVAAIGLRWRTCLPACAFLLGVVGFLGFLSEDRYFLPLSFGFSLLLLIDPNQARRLTDAFPGQPWLPVAFGCVLIGADLLPGTFTNASWICTRDVATPVRLADPNGPQSETQVFLASLVAQYKQTCPPPGLPPVILAENDRLNSPYLGTQRIFHVFTQAMIARFLAAKPERQASMPNAVLAVVYQHPAYPADMLGAHQQDYRACYDGDGLHVLCSLRLAPSGPACSQSLY